MLLVKNRGNVVKIGETLDKIGKPGNFEEAHFFPVSAPEHEALLSHNPWLAASHVNRGQPPHSCLNSIFSIETGRWEEH